MSIYTHIYRYLCTYRNIDIYSFFFFSCVWSSLQHVEGAQLRARGRGGKKDEKLTSCSPAKGHRGQVFCQKAKPEISMGMNAMAKDKMLRYTQKMYLPPY